MLAGTYEVVITGTLSEGLTVGIEAAQHFSVSHVDQGETHFVGWVADQARLFGLLDAFQRLGIEVISVNPITTDSKGSPRT